jgi:DNA-binding response OmpR family regulator
MTDRAKILIVDDDPDFTESLACFLEARGHRVMRASDSDRGVELARSCRPEVIVMDVMMRERTEGFFAIQEIRRIPELADVPVFAVSAIYTAEPTFTIAPEAGWLAHDEFFRKPVDLDELALRIEARIADRREQEEARLP